MKSILTTRNFPFFQHSYMNTLKLFKIHRTLKWGDGCDFLVAIEEIFPLAFTLIGIPGTALLFQFKTNKSPYCLAPFDSTEFFFNFSPSQNQIRVSSSPTRDRILMPCSPTPETRRKRVFFQLKNWTHFDVVVLNHVLTSAIVLYLVNLMAIPVNGNVWSNNLDIITKFTSEISQLILGKQTYQIPKSI